MALSVLINRIFEKTRIAFKPAQETDLAKLQDMRVPEPIIDFYRKYEPSKVVEIGDVRLLPISDIIFENTQLIPGAYTAPHGFMVFATTISGDVYCFDFNHTVNSQHRIVLIPHDIDFEGMEKNEIYEYTYEVAKNLEDFLEKFLSEKLEIEPL